MEDKEASTIPAWDGRPETFERYREDGAIYVEGTKYGERYLCAPRMIRRLRGAARTACLRVPPRTFSHEQGVEQLMIYLEKHLGKPEVPNVGGCLEEYFYKIRRRRGESMAAWCVRSRDVYDRCQKALARVLKPEEKPTVLKKQLHADPKKQRPRPRSRATGRRSPTTKASNRPTKSGAGTPNAREAGGGAAAGVPTTGPAEGPAGLRRRSRSPWPRRSCRRSCRAGSS